VPDGGLSLRDPKPRQGGYTLVICEKPDAARRVSEALSDDSARSVLMEGTTVYRFSRRGEDYVVCSAQGHVYGVSDPFSERTVYPVFDLEWYPSDVIGEETGAARRIAVVKRLAAGASSFVNACDFDVEGETIGFNLLRYACGAKEEDARRAKFSTLTKEELVAAFDNAGPQSRQGLARAGRARHLIDFVWGVNLSRVLSRLSRKTGKKYRTVSIGRVQGPTLEFLVQRERGIREFVPVPFWKVSGIFEKGGRKITADYVKERVGSKEEAGRVKDYCSVTNAVVTDVRRSQVQVGPPVPFNIGDLQKDAYRAFRFSPRRTLQVAERLYLRALISYPRTGSQRLPPSIGYRQVLEGLGQFSEYSSDVEELLKGDLKPSQGSKVDSAHPAIYPTGEKSRHPLGRDEASVFDLVVRRFLATFGLTARREVAAVRIAAGGHEFRLNGTRMVFPGWMRYYGKYSGFRDVELPPVSVGDRLRVVRVDAEERFEQRPSRYNQSSLLDRMEKEGIGTKATRADIIATLASRGYVSGESMEVTDLGLAVSEVMNRFAPSIMTTGLTRQIEEALEAVESGVETDSGLLRATVREIAGQLSNLSANEDASDLVLNGALANTVPVAYTLGSCPVCMTGQLGVVKSKTTKKRFVGCSNYGSGCLASAPLPQKGAIRATRSPCRHCSWPVVYVLGGRRPWKLCVNPVCPSKREARS
jgi:DNA topoisomerase I